MFESYWSYPGIPKVSSDIPLTSNRKTTIIKEVVAEQYGITVTEMHKKTRERRIVDSRHVVFFFLRNMTSSCLKEIGEPFHQDHTTVVHGINKVKDLMESDFYFNRDVDELFGLINSRFREYKIYLANKMKEEIKVLENSN